MIDGSRLTRNPPEPGRPLGPQSYPAQGPTEHGHERRLPERSREPRLRERVLADEEIFRKGGRTHVVPLPHLALGRLKNLRPVAGKAPWVFATPRRRQPGSRLASHIDGGLPPN